MIYVGTLHDNPNRDIGWINEFRDIGWNVIPFSNDYDINTLNIFARIRKRFHFGRLHKLMETSLLGLVDSQNPVWVHFRLPVSISKNVILEIKKRGCLVTEYFNDDPFSAHAKIFYFYKFKKALKHYDIHFVYRKRNVDQFFKSGARLVYHCKPTYDSRRHYIHGDRNISNFIADVAFIGHYEKDKRLTYLEALYKSSFKIVLKGGMWNKAIRNSSLSELGDIVHAFGEEYNYIYSNVVAGLCFFSKINNDSWTERPLEIVAVGGLLVCERTEEAVTYFKDREEAFYFSSTEELIMILNKLKADINERERVRMNGYKKLLNSKNSIADRALEIHEIILKNLKK